MVLEVHSRGNLPLPVLPQSHKGGAGDWSLHFGETIGVYFSAEDHHEREIPQGWMSVIFGKEGRYSVSQQILGKSPLEIENSNELLKNSYVAVYQLTLIYGIYPL